MLKNWIKATLILFLLWLILSGHFEAKYILIGLGASAVIAYFCLPAMVISGKHEKYHLMDVSIHRLIGYMIWLLGEIVKSSLSVAVAIMSPKMKINPQLVEFECEYANPVAVTLLVNSIILTPGTVTVDVIDDIHFVVHALTDQAAKGLLEGTMQRKIGNLFGEQIAVEGAQI